MKKVYFTHLLALFASLCCAAPSLAILANTIQFDSASALIEPGTEASVLVDCGPISAPITVPFTVGGTAVPVHSNPNLPSDYSLDSPADKVLHFSPGDTQQYIFFAISGDLAPGKGKTIVITLDTPSSGGAVGSPSTTTLTIDQHLPLVGGKNFTAVPAKTGETWSFSYIQASTAAGLNIVVQCSPDGQAWAALPGGGAMLRTTTSPSSWTLSTTNVPDGSHYFRAVSSAPGYVDTPSSVFSNYLPPTTGLKITTKAPAKSGQAWTFTAQQPAQAKLLMVRFQSSPTPDDSGVWTDLPIYSPTVAKGATWTSTTYNIPSGTNYFRAVAAAPGWVDSVSVNSAAYSVAASTLLVAPLTNFTIAHDGTIHSPGDPVVFSVNESMSTAKVRFQSKLSSQTQESDWTDLPTGGSLFQVKTKWVLATTFVPTGDRDFRAIASATGYLDTTSETQSLSIAGPRLPQIATNFTDFIFPSPSQRVFHTGETINVKMGVQDDNGLQNVKLQYATTKIPFTDAGNGQMTDNGDGTYSGTLNFGVAGTYFVRVAATDNFSPPPVGVCYSQYITLTVAEGGGTSAPTFGAFIDTVVPSTLKARGSVTVSVPVADDKQVYKVYLHRSDSTGHSQGAVGEMAQTSIKGNSAYRTLTDSSLADGTYYYVVFALDYDGNLSASPVQGPFTLNTPIPPPPIITLDVTPESRLVNPTFPPKNPLTDNHPSMPRPTSGTVHLTYSGLTAGSNQLIGFRTGGSPSDAFVTMVLTKLSGDVTLPAPLLMNTTTGGEGSFEFHIYRGGEAYPIDVNSVNTFTVGHSWNQPSTFTQLDWGLYWFKDVANGLKATGVGQNDDYFDPNKPTIIYVHGWQFNESGLKRRESWDRINPVTNAHNDLCKIWKSFGYNVGLFYWNQFAWDPGLGLYKSEAKIYGTTGDKGTDAPGHGMTYALYDKNGQDHMAIWVDPDGYQGIGDQSVCDLFYGEMVRCFKNYDPAGKDFRIVGHSLGTQVIGRTMYLLHQADSHVPLPTRIALFDLAETNTTTLPAPYAGYTIPQLQLSFLSDLASAGVAIESYQSTDLESFLGIIGTNAKPVYDLTAYERIRPDWINPFAFADSHGESIRWYSESRVFNELPAYTYGGPFWRTGYAGYGISATTSTERIKALMGGHTYYNQTEGKNSSDLSDDGFEVKTDR